MLPRKHGRNDVFRAPIVFQFGELPSRNTPFQYPVGEGSAIGSAIDSASDSPGSGSSKVRETKQR